MNGVAIAVIAAGLIAFMPSSWEQRMRTIETYQQDNSAQSRLGAWRFCANVANHRLLGGGFDLYTPMNYAVYAPAESVGTPVAHSIYFSIVFEHGYGGLFLFLLLWWLTFRCAARIRRQARDRPEMAWTYHLAGMCQVSMVGYLAGGAFLQLAYFDLPYNILVVLVVTDRWIREGGWHQEKVGAFGSGKPITAAAAPHPAANKLT